MSLTNDILIPTIDNQINNEFLENPKHLNSSPMPNACNGFLLKSKNTDTTTNVNLLLKFYL